MRQPSGTVTLLFTDIEGSTRLLEELGAEAYRDALDAHRRVLREAFARHGGYEVDYEGDAFFVSFSRADAAVAAADEAQRALENGRVRVRMGLHTGEPILDPPKYVGRDVHLAARIMSAGHGGQVLLSRSTAALVDRELRDLGEHRLKDFDEAARLFQLGDDAFPPLKTISNTNLPVPVSSFLGRDAELKRAEESLASARLLTITGPGGTGKTRFAIELASGQIDRYANGVFWVPLAPLRDPAFVLDTLDQSIGGKGALAEHIGEKHMLVLLDNFEHVIDSAPALGALLAECPNLTLVVTSRELLRIAGECEHSLPPLEPGDGTALFCERAGVEPTPAVAELCRRLDNLPLAIELAAARTGMLTPEKLLERLGQRLDLLRGGRDADARQQTLRATIEWSHDLLAPAEQELFARLSVFAGGCTVEAAEAVVDLDLGTLESLIDKSLVRRTADRFWMLETIREYAAERLEEDGAGAEQRRRFLDWSLELAEGASAESHTGNQEQSFERLAADHDNLRAAIAIAGETDPESELGLASALWEFWAAHGPVTEGLRLLDDALARTEARPLRLRLGRAYLGFMAGEGFSEGLAEFEEVARLAAASGERLTQAQALTYAGIVQLSLGTASNAEASIEEALAVSRGDYPALEGEAIGWLLVTTLFGPLPTDRGIARCRDAFLRAGANRTVQAFALVERAPLEAMRGDFATARRLLTEGRAILQELGLHVYAANTAQEAYFVEMLAGNPKAAVADLSAAYDTLADMGERGFLSTVAGFLAHAAYAAGDADGAARAADRCAEAAASDDLSPQALWRSARAKLLSWTGDLDASLRLAEEAVGLYRPTDDLNQLAERLDDFAEVCEPAGRPDDATAARREALDLYERKGNLVAAERTRRLLATSH